MQSTRLDKDGKAIPSLKDPFDLWKVENRRIGTVTEYPHSRYSGYEGSIFGDVGSMDDVDWHAYNLTRRAQTTVLSSSTSLGDPATNRAIMEQATRTQEDLNRFLVQWNCWAQGDFVTFKGYPVLGNLVTLHTIYQILYTERNIKDVKWPEKISAPKPFLLLSLAPLIPNFEWDMAARWNDNLHLRHLTREEHTHFLKHNVQLPDYIGQAKAAHKAGTLKIE